MPQRMKCGRVLSIFGILYPWMYKDGKRGEAEKERGVPCRRNRETVGERERVMAGRAHKGHQRAIISTEQVTLYQPLATP